MMPVLRASFFALMKKTQPKALYPAGGSNPGTDLFGGDPAAAGGDKQPVSGRIGTDESGKGDYFGPLVTAAVWVDEALEEKLSGLGVRDSKKISDGRVTEIARRITADVPHAVVVIGPSKYNELYGKIRNLNRLLAWAHARAIENLLEKVSCTTVIADKFGDEKYVQNALMKKGREVQLIQRVRAEADIAVAAASIVARAEFLRRLKSLSAQIGFDLHKGASDLVDQDGLRIVQSGGKDKLLTVAKWHFKNTKKILARYSAAR